MNTMNLAAAPARLTLKQLLVVDALTCVVTGLLFVIAAAPLAGLLGLPQNLLFYAGLVLFPCAALMTLAARTQSPALVWLVILGNLAWAVGSVVVVFAFEPTALGTALTLGQAAVVALLGILEWRAR
jgi:glucose uptake protein GlcU